jgi:glycerophosphoryl diester phosphodiesterase
MLHSLTSPVIFAHRGASSHAPENTLEAFQAALDQGAQAIELDVQLTLDQEVVVFHDIHLSRTTDGAGKLRDFPLSELKKLNAAISFYPAYEKASIPTLAEALDFLPQDIFVNIELKNLSSPFNDLPAKTADVIRKINVGNRVLISSFNIAALHYFNRSAPEIPRGLLLRTPFLANVYRNIPAFFRRIQSIHLPFKALNPPLIASYKAMGLKIFSYTLNHTEDIEAAIKMGIDGFFTDDPGFAFRILRHDNLVK